MEGKGRERDKNKKKGKRGDSANYMDKTWFGEGVLRVEGMEREGGDGEQGT